MGHHVFRIGEAFLETAVDGVEYAMQLANVPPKEGTFTTGDEIARYGETVIQRLQQWWDGLADKSCQQKVKTFFGMQPLYMLYERSTWHSAQHARQLARCARAFRHRAQRAVNAGRSAGLPLPERLVGVENGDAEAGACIAGCDRRSPSRQPTHSMASFTKPSGG